MIRLALLLALAFALDAGAQTFPTPGPGHAPWVAVSGGGGFCSGAGSGVETRYAELLLDPHFVVGCSEPMDGPNGAFFTNPPFGSSDSALSPNGSECWGRAGSGWQPAGYQDPPSPPAGQTIVPVTGWGSVQYASRQAVGRGDWWLAYKTTQLASDFGLTSATVCYRYYKQVSSDYQPASSDCGGGTYRNKFMQANNFRPYGVLGCNCTPAGACNCNDQYQIQEDQFNGCASPGNFTRPIIACYGSGPSMEPDESCRGLTPTVRLDAALSKPIRIEQCFEATNLANGSGWQVHALVTRLDTTPAVTSSRSTALVAENGAPNFNDFTGGDLDHTGGGQSWNGYFLFAVWDNVAGHRIGKACEIEGG